MQQEQYHPTDPMDIKTLQQMVAMTSIVPGPTIPVAAPVAVPVVATPARIQKIKKSPKKSPKKCPIIVSVPASPKRIQKSQVKDAQFYNNIMDSGKLKKTFGLDINKKSLRISKN